MKKKNRYKFTGKKHSKRGMFACISASASIFALAYMIAMSFWQKGNGSIYLGSAGILALAAAFFALAEAVKSLREEDTFRRMPAVSLLLSLLAAGSWIAVYAVGFFLSYPAGIPM